MPFIPHYRETHFQVIYSYNEIIIFYCHHFHLKNKKAIVQKYLSPISKAHQRTTESSSFRFISNIKISFVQFP